MASMTLPISLFILFAWFGFIPRVIAYSEESFLIDMLICGNKILPWSELKYYGQGNNVFMIQFNGTRTFQISKLAYSSDQWTDFVTFLQTNFPDKKATGSIGDRMFKWGN